MASSSSLVCNAPKRFLVFISFRGEDTRNNFVSHLYNSLKEKGIDTFKDDEKLEKGVFVKPGLFEAIQHSKLSIVILSKNYASSTWCLEELSKILECRKLLGQIVVPVFYGVDPSDVRHQRGSFANSFVEHEEKFKHEIEKVNKWKKGLHKVANISGHDSRGRDESRLIKEIIDDISHKILPMQNVSSGLVSMDSIMENIDELLELGSNDVRMLGIWGMAGIGKTTIAEVAYERISSQFEVCCFLHNVKDKFHKNNGDVATLQEELVSRISKQGNVSFETKIGGRGQIQLALFYRRVLIVLDDVDDSKQLKELVGSYGWFGLGTRIIITTRDRNLLVQHKVQYIYEAQKLNDADALQLFYQYAFNKEQPASELQDLSEQIISYCQGLPLALEVLGLLMCGRSKLEWEAEIQKLKRVPDWKIQNVLRSSYDGLDNSQKALFLDIACFFSGWEKALVEKILDASHIDMSMLVERSLITIVKEYGRREVICMHDLLQETGREIVRQNSKGRLEDQSHLFDYEDVCNLFTRNMDADKVKAISLHLDKTNDGSKEIDAYWTPFPSSLKYLCWNECSLSRPLSKSSCENLVVLKMRHSPAERLWKGAKCLRKLKMLDLTSCENLKKIPNLSGAPNLEKLLLGGCRNLIEGHWSVGHLTKLKDLDLQQCKRLKNFSWLNRYEGSRQTHVLLDRLKPSKFRRGFERNKCLTCLRLSNAPFKELPSAIENLQSLQSLSLVLCPRLEILTDSIWKLKSLRDLYVHYCPKLSAISDISEPMPNLKVVILGVTGLTTLPSSICKLQSLELLNLDYCSKFATLPATIGTMTALAKICLDGTAIKSLPSIEGYYSNLPSIEDCNRTLQRLRGNLSNSLQRYQRILRNYSSEKDSISNVLRKLSNSESNLKRMLAELEITLDRLPSPWRPSISALYSRPREGYSEIGVELSLAPFEERDLELQFKACNYWEVLKMNGMPQIERIIHRASLGKDRSRFLYLGFKENYLRMRRDIRDVSDRSDLEPHALEEFVKCILSSTSE